MSLRLSYIKENCKITGINMSEHKILDHDKDNKFRTKTTN